MALKTLPALPLALLLLALALVLPACGGGSTAGPIAATTDAATSPVPATQPAPPRTTRLATQTATAPSPTASAPAPTPQPSAPRARQGGAAAPDAGEQDSGSTSSSAAAADEPTPAPAAPTTPTTEQHAGAPVPAPAPEPASSVLDETARLTLVNRVSPAHYFQQGTVTGTYDGTMDVEARITSKGVIVRFTATLPGGTITGRGIAVAILDSLRWPGLRGTARVTGGTGRFAGIHGRILSVTGRARPDASKAHVRLAGTVSY